jgi:tetratricopeptide (TPR) repeat protein
MSDQEAIANQERLLSEHRRRLAVLLHQHARLGIHAPPHISLEIEDVQGLIHTHKAQLRAWNVPVEDRPEDTAAGGRASPGDALAQAQALLAMLPLDTIPDPAVLPVGSRMLLSRNSSFVGRIADLKHLAAALKGGQTAVIGQTAAVTGLGGMGKTNLATEFVHRYGHYFAGGVFWLSFADPAAVPSEVAACGVGLDLPGFAALTLNDRAARVMQVWQQPLPRLLIFDNCEEEALLAEWRPTSGGCRVLITSRRTRWSTVLNVQALGLGVLTREESIALLRMHRPDVDEHDPNLDSIAAELGDLPLALHLAGSYLESYRDDPDFGDPAAFLAELRDARLIDHPALYGEDVTPSPTNHALHVGRTFALSYEQLRPDDPTDALAIKLLARTACFAPGVPISRDLLLATIESPDKAAQRRGSKALRRLVDLGLLGNEQDGMLTLHRLLAQFVGSVVADETAQRAVEEAVGAVAADLNRKVDLPGLVAIQAHLRHIATVAMPREEPHVAWLCNEFAEMLYLMGDLAGVHPYVERALAIRERMLGPDHPDTAAILNNLGQLFRAQGQYAVARPFYERALAIQERVLGSEHPDTARTLNNLGALVWEQGDLQGAHRHVERALAIREQVLGPEHPDTAMEHGNDSRQTWPFVIIAGDGWRSPNLLPFSTPRCLPRQVY